jgi:GNAT superfamily N-acetyltransferase
VPEAPRIRSATAVDAEAIATLIRIAFASQSVETDPPPSARLETTESVEAHFAAGGGGAVVEDCSAAVLWVTSESGLAIRRLSVHPSRRRQGLARLLLHRAEEEAIALGLRRVSLSTRLVLADNRRLFASCGYVETQQHAHSGYALPTFVDLEKRLR